MTKRNKRQVKAVRRIVVRARRIMFASRLISAVLTWAAICLGGWLMLFYADNLLHLPAGLRLAMSLGGMGLMVFALGKSVLAPVHKRGDLEGMALALEQEYGIPENMLINALQFEGRRFGPGEAPFARQTIRSGLSLVSRTRLKGTWRLKRLNIIMSIARKIGK